jgi:hypothetical protein
MNATACRWLLSCIVGILAFNAIAFAGLIAGQHIFDSPEAGLVAASTLAVSAVAALSLCNRNHGQ